MAACDPLATLVVSMNTGSVQVVQVVGMSSAGTIVVGIVSQFVVSFSFSCSQSRTQGMFRVCAVAGPLQHDYGRLEQRHGTVCRHRAR